jgi:hypothetical protein
MVQNGLGSDRAQRNAAFSLTRALRLIGRIVPVKMGRVTSREIGTGLARLTGYQTASGKWSRIV